MKRAQRFRLEDQRGTEINFELPDFLKDSGRSKLRKVKQLHDGGNTNISSTVDGVPKKPLGKAPQPAPRHSITTVRQNSSILNEKIDDNQTLDSNSNSIIEHIESNLETSQISTSSSSSSHGNNKSIVNHFNLNDSYYNGNEIQDGSLQRSHYGNGPPPLPPKPKIKPTNWVSGSAIGTDKINIHSKEQATSPFRNHSRITATACADNKTPSPRKIYLDQPNSSFV